MAHDVFISHSDHDKLTAQAVCAKLEGIGVRCWIAPRDVPAGSNWVESIVDAIGESRIMVVLLSGSANESPYVGRELSNAVDEGLIIIPFRIEDVPLSKSLAWLVRSIHWLDALTPPLEGHLQELARVVTAILQSDTPNATAAGQVGMPPVYESPARRRIKPIALVMLGALVVAALAFLVFKPSKHVTSPTPDSSPSAKYIENRNSFIGALPWLNWILYEPTGYDPYQSIEASDSNIRKDLQVLRQHGFDGLITASSRGTLGRVPRIAHEEGFHMVIVGVWEINDRDEVDNALKAAPYAEASRTPFGSEPQGRRQSSRRAERPTRASPTSPH